MSGRWSAWRRRTAAERAALVEAFAALALASFAVRFIAFRRIARFASRRSAGSPPGDAEAIVTRVAWAVDAAARRAPFRAVCIERGLAAQAMLRRRGIAAVLHYGVAQAARVPGQPESDGLAAHVWVVHGSRDVTGGAEAAGFTRLASFPDSPLDREN